MKQIRWNEEKNETLQIDRGVSFEMIVKAVERGDILDDLIHPNQSKYSNQRMMIVKLNNYAYLVPYVENSSEIFLKTIIPSRKATKQYLIGDNKNESI
ncbi:BrnT family toxin [Crocosphaera sp. UHCC 0190]|uniref:BrnT family toxin n=1 Tax=Crocosphaera sp. UHCC 0190 TaxID=3110246 RepID=UPI002B1FE712|nr:BrnT family toxin [Crocosphaera sp. UHCC 0190]MEA5509177.1 BrnT family toxin [Crocosphaera sp. UHCC 0190]